MAYNFTTLKNELKKAEEFLAKEYRQLNVGRASPSILDSIMVESYGSTVPLKNVASIGIEDPKTLRVNPWDKSQVKEVERSIAAANLGLSVAVDDAGIRVIFPALTTENRQSLVKILKEKLEEARIVTRREREKVWDDVQTKERGGVVTQDEKFRAKDEIQKIMDETNKNLEALFSKKEQEVMGN